MTTSYSHDNDHTCQLNYHLTFFTILSLLFALILFAPTTANSSDSATKNISVDFYQTDLQDCIKQILHLGDVKTEIAIDNGIARIISKKANNTHWDTILKEILKENRLKLVKQTTGYLIVDNTPIKTQTNSQTRNKTITIKQHELTNSDSCMNDSEIITLGYKYASGANPFALVGKCLKLKNVTPFQYLNARQAYVHWSYRGASGTVFVEDKSESGLAINSSKVMVGRVISTHDYGTVIGSKQIIPHLVILSE